MLKQALDNSRVKRQLFDENQEQTSRVSERIDALETKLNLILQKLESVEQGTNKMGYHIDFINDVYLRVQTPLFWLCDRVNYLRGYKIDTTQHLVDDKSDITDQD